MNKSNFNMLIRGVKKFTMEHTPEILTGIGVTGMISATIMAVAATPKALTLLEEEKKSQNIAFSEEAKNSGYDDCRQITKLGAMDVIKTTWKCYIPTAITLVGSTACIIGASSINYKRNAALATAYALTETALKDYKDKVVETIGEKNEETIREKIIKDKIDSNPVENNEIILTGKGETLFYDCSSGRYFKSDVEKVKRVQNELNHRLMSEHYISLNELYYELGLRSTESGNELGWNLDDGLIEIHYSAQLTENEKPCIAISFMVGPRYNYAYNM